MGRHGAVLVDPTEGRGLGGISRGLATSGPTRYSGKIIPWFALIIFCWLALIGRHDMDDPGLEPSKRQHPENSRPRVSSGNPQYVEKMRPCLKCGEQFMSFGVGNRICKKCKDRNRW